MINNLIFCCCCCYCVILLVQIAKLQMRNAKSSKLGHFDICCQMYAAQMSDEKSSSS